MEADRRPIVAHDQGLSGGATRDTIFALSSGPAPAAIAVIRISGPAAAAALVAFAGRVPPPRRASLARLTDRAGGLLDEALLLWFPGPRTATGEDLAELHLHGGRATVAAVQHELATLSGCRPATPGEFTRRAFVNGRVDLAEVEGLADLLAAETEAERRRALTVAGGGLSRLIEGWRVRLLEVAARVEALIEFSDEGDVGNDLRLAEDIADLASELDEALARPPAERLRDGVRIMFAGPVNAGKSSLVNALAGRDVALATPIAGTTRDLIEAPVVLEGEACVLIDGAGLRDTSDPVERLGVDRARAAIEEADLLVWLGDPRLCPPAPARLCVHPRADLPEQAVVPNGVDVAVSVKDGRGLDELRSRLLEKVRSLLPTPDKISFNLRQRRDVEASTSALHRAATATDLIIQAEELRSSCANLDAIQGRASTDDMLDALFSRFCIGK